MWERRDHFLWKACRHRESFVIEDGPAPRLTCRRGYAGTATHCPKTYPCQNPLPLNARPHQDCLWSARKARHAQHGAHRADHHRPSPITRGINRKPLATRAQRTCPTFKCTNAQRGRPRGRDGLPCRFHALNTGLAAQRASKSVAPRSGGPDGGRPRLRSGAFAPDCPILILVVACGDCLRIPSGASRLPAIGSARPRGYGFRGSLRC